MAQGGLMDYFEGYISKDNIFNNKKLLQSNYAPGKISHRERQIKEIASIFAPALRSEKPSNLFIYGKTGAGKTMAIKYILKTILETTQEKNIDVKMAYINCKLKRIADTEYRLIAQLAREFGKEIPSTGLPTDEVYKIFFNAVEKEQKPILLVLDEIDQLIKKTGDGVLYNLTRCNEELKNSQITLVGLSNDMIFIDNLDPRVKSSLSEEELVFPPYNALQLQDILKQRAKTAFRKGVLEQGTIEKCAAYSAREHGDARRALELLRVAGELAERDNETNLALKYIDKAEEKIDKDRLIDVITTQPKQSQSILYSIIDLSNQKKGNLFTGEIYSFYKSLCNKVALRPLTQRRISDVIAELDMVGVIHAKIISKGRYGRTREISLAMPDSSIMNIKKILEKELDLA